MFAAAVLVARWIWDAVQKAALWIATKTLIILLLAIVMPWVLRKFFIWGFDFLTKYGTEYAGYITTQIGDALTSAGLQTNIDLELTGVGGYIALKTGLIEYISIITVGWGLYWVIVFTIKSGRKII